MLNITASLYVGDGGTQVIEVGFAPKLVIVKANHATNGHAMFITDTMANAQNFTNATEDAGIVLTSTGFTVTHIASSTGRTNESGKIYYWWAAGGNELITGTYAGNGTGQTINPGHQPIMVWIRREGVTGTFFRTASMGAESYDFNVSSGATDEITTLDVTGFTLGTSSTVNQSGITFHYVSWESAANIAEGTYTGDGNDNRNLPPTPLFDEELIYICGIKADAGQQAVWKHVVFAIPDSSFIYGTGAVSPNRIQSFVAVSGGFQVGTDARVNSDTVTYYYYALALSTIVENVVEVSSGGIVFSGTASIINSPYSAIFKGGPRFRKEGLGIPNTRHQHRVWEGTKTLATP